MGQTPTVQNKIDAAKAGVTGELGSGGLFGEAIDWAKDKWFS
jgi:uncharacterized membrane protein (Fun14 family)